MSTMREGHFFAKQHRAREFFDEMVIRIDPAVIEDKLVTINRPQQMIEDYEGNRIFVYAIEREGDRLAFGGREFSAVHLHEDIGFLSTLYLSSRVRMANPPDRPTMPYGMTITREGIYFYEKTQFKWPEPVDNSWLHHVDGYSLHQHNYLEALYTSLWDYHYARERENQTPR